MLSSLTLHHFSGGWDFLNGGHSGPQVLLQAVRILELNLPGRKCKFHPEERLPPFPSQVSACSCALTRACKHTRALVSLLSISVHGTLRDSGTDPISCLGGVGFWMAAEHKGRHERTETAVVTLKGWGCIWWKKSLDLLLCYRKGVMWLSTVLSSCDRGV